MTDGDGAAAASGPGASAPGAADVAQLVLSAVAAMADPARSTTVTADTPLTEAGVDSLGIATLVIDLERALGRRLPAAMIDKRVFHSARTIADALRGMTPEPA